MSKLNLALAVIPDTNVLWRNRHLSENRPEFESFLEGKAGGLYYVGLPIVILHNLQLWKITFINIPIGSPNADSPISEEGKNRLQTTPARSGKLHLTIQPIQNNKSN